MGYVPTLNITHSVFPDIPPVIKKIAVLSQCHAPFFAEEFE